jgi:hypothetical protein
LVTTARNKYLSRISCGEILDSFLHRAGVYFKRLWVSVFSLDRLFF